MNNQRFSADLLFILMICITIVMFQEGAKYMPKWIRLLCLMLVLVGCASNPVKPDLNVCGFECEDSDMSEYVSLEGEEHVFLDATFEEAYEMLENDTFSGIIYYGYPACPWCEEAVVEMNDAAKSLGLEIYYVNKKSDFNILHPELEEKTALLLDKAYALSKDEEGKPHLYVPEVVVVKAGKVVDHHMGTFEEHDAHERDLNEKEKQQLEEIYVQMFKKVK